MRKFIDIVKLDQDGLNFHELVRCSLTKQTTFITS